MEGCRFDRQASTSALPYDRIDLMERRRLRLKQFKTGIEKNGLHSGAILPRLLPQPTVFRGKHRKAILFCVADAPMREREGSGAARRPQTNGACGLPRILLDRPRCHANRPETRSQQVWH